ncbi:MAG: hypothetical protein BGO67_02190 [Alphaproteobacteria bacterium 41-28]|nr:MAG: hypothetical protein BGO67_02190 [Alphaproteobacteria bacterium 41-28]
MKIKALTFALLVTVSPAFAMEGQFEGSEDTSHGVKRKRDESSSQKKDPQAKNTDEAEQKKSRVDGSDDQTDSQGEEAITSNNFPLDRLSQEEIQFLSSLSPDKLMDCLRDQRNAERLKETRARYEKIYALKFRSYPGGSRLECSDQDMLNYGLGQPVSSLEYRIYGSTDEDFTSFCDILRTLASIKSIKLSGFTLLEYPKIASSLKLVYQTLETIKVEELKIEDNFRKNKHIDIFLSDFWPHILKMETLKKLSLDSNSHRLPQQIFKDLMEVKLPLTDFEVEAMDFKKETAIQLGSWIAESTFLRRVVMVNATFTLKGMEYLAEAIDRNRNFESFDVRECCVTDETYPKFPEFLEIMLKQPKIITGLKLKEEKLEEGTDN